jgi:hypothetical protein
MDQSLASNDAFRFLMQQYTVFEQREQVDVAENAAEAKVLSQKVMGLMDRLKPRLCYSSELSECVSLSILGRLSHRGGAHAAMVCRKFRATV